MISRRRNFKVALFLVAAIVIGGLVILSLYIFVTASTVTHNQVNTFTTSGAFTVPAGVTELVLEAWGAGGGGQIGAFSKSAGGGGAYCKATIAVSAGQSYTVTVGTSAINTDGGDSKVDLSGSVKVLAPGGKSGSNGRAGGAGADGTGDTCFDGGNGGVGAGNQPGGGSAGDESAGSGATPGEENGGFGVVNGTNVPSAGGASSQGSGTAGGRGEVRITYDAVATEGFPAVRARAWTRYEADTDPHVIDLPTYQIGDLLLAFFMIDGSNTTVSGSSGWTKIDSDNSSTVMEGAVFYKYASNSSESLTVTMLSSNQSSSIVLSIKGGGIPTSSSTNGVSTNADPPNHNPAVSQKYLWIASAGWDNDGNFVTLGSSTSYTSFIDVPSGTSGGVRAATEERFLEASSENPGAFTSSSENWITFTVSVPPVDPGGPSGLGTGVTKTLIKGGVTIKGGATFKFFLPIFNLFQEFKFFPIVTFGLTQLSSFFFNE